MPRAFLVKNKSRRLTTATDSKSETTADSRDIDDLDREKRRNQTQNHEGKYSTDAKNKRAIELLYAVQSDLSHAVADRNRGY